MKLKGELKEKIEKAENKEQAKDILDKAGVELTDEELEEVSGGMRLDLRFHCCKCGGEFPGMGISVNLIHGGWGTVCSDCYSKLGPGDFSSIP